MNLNKKNIILLIANIIFSISFISLTSFIIVTHNKDLFLIIILIINTFLYFFTCILSLFIIYKLSYSNLEIQQLSEKILHMQDFHDKTRALKHDFANIAQGMEGYIDNKDFDGLKKYNSQFIENIRELDSLSVFTSDIINNPAIYSVLSQKYDKSKSLGIKINFEIMTDLNKLNIKIFDFTRVLGILMDNAIEASNECDNKIINVSITENLHKNKQVLLVQNTYKNKNIDTNKIFEKGYSTKEKNSGLGLWEIKQILKKNNNLNLYTTKNDTFFTQQFEIYI